MHSFPFQKQKDIVLACFALHNFIKLTEGEDDIYKEWDKEQDASTTIPDNLSFAATANDDARCGAVGAEHEKAARIFRDNIALEMWDEYKEYMNTS